MEEAVFIRGISDLEDLHSKYSRIYFGNEFCQRLIPAEKEINEILRFTLDKGLNFTFVTGFVTDAGLKCLEELLVFISSKAKDAEVVINDWGMLGMVRKHSLIPVVGRLLTKQKRDPRIISMLKKIPQKGLKCLQSAAIGPYMMSFLRDNHVKRVEIDNLPQGVRLEESVVSENLRVSLYFPFNYVTTSRNCIFNDGIEQYEKTSLFECARKCRHDTLILKHHSIPMGLYLKGNTVFLENCRMPDEFVRKSIDRIVYQPAIPM